MTDPIVTVHISPYQSWQGLASQAPKAKEEKGKSSSYIITPVPMEQTDECDISDSPSGAGE